MQIKSIAVENIKALSVIIGNNGSGNSKKTLEKLLRNATCRVLNPRRSYGH